MTRQALMADKSLSTTTKNIKGITINGLVTLRGPVNNPPEREQIVAKAQDMAGVDNVENQRRSRGTNHTDNKTERNRAKTTFEQAGAEDISYTEEARV